jgi:hypothetical protein
MSIYINDAAVTLFDPMPKQAFQEKGFKLRGTVRTRNDVTGDTIKFPKLAAGLAQQKAIQDDIVPLNLVWSQATVTMQDWHASDYSDIFGQRDVNFDEVNELGQALGMAIGRRADQQIIDALAASGTTNTIAHGDTGFTYAKFLTMNKFFTTNNLRQNGNEFHVAIDGTAEEDLLNETNFISSDFTRQRILDNGSSLNGMDLFGFKWHVFGDMDEGGIPLSGSTYTAYAWTKNAMGQGIGMDFSTEVNYIPTKTSFLATSKYRAGVGVIDAVGVVDISYQ